MKFSVWLMCKENAPDYWSQCQVCWNHLDKQGLEYVIGDWGIDQNNGLVRMSP